MIHQMLEKKDLRTHPSKGVDRTGKCPERNPGNDCIIIPHPLGCGVFRAYESHALLLLLLLRLLLLLSYPSSSSIHSFTSLVSNVALCVSSHARIIPCTHGKVLLLSPFGALAQRQYPKPPASLGLSAPSNPQAPQAAWASRRCWAEMEDLKWFITPGS